MSTVNELSDHRPECDARYDYSTAAATTAATATTAAAAAAAAAAATTADSDKHTGESGDTNLDSFYHIKTGY